MHPNTKLVLSLLALASVPPCLPAQQVWTRRAPATAPGRTSYGYLAYDAARDVTVRFGGWNGGGATAATWEWNGRDWLRRAPALEPGPVCFHGGIVYDVARRCTVLFGGWESVGVVRNDTWTWDGQTWTRRQPPNAPPARLAHAICYDSRRQRVLVFGGSDDRIALDDMWAWDGTDWTELQPAARPPAMLYSSMVYDSSRDRAVLFGGSTSTTGGGLHAETWEFDGTTWRQLSPPTAPAPRSHHTMVYDQVQRAVVMFGGFSNSQPRWFGDLWMWDGTSWSRRSPRTGPSARCCPGMAFDAAKGRIVLFGGCDNMVRNDTWELHAAAPTSLRTLGTPCMGSTGPVAISALSGSLPWLDSTLALRCTNAPPTFGRGYGLLGASATAWSGGSLPAPLDAWGMTGCTLLVAPDVVVSGTQAAGMLLLSVPIPPDPDLLGGRFFVQGLTVDPTANPLGLVASDALEVIVGAR